MGEVFFLVSTSYGAPATLSVTFGIFREKWDMGCAKATFLVERILFLMDTDGVIKGAYIIIKSVQFDIAAICHKLCLKDLHLNCYNLFYFVIIPIHMKKSNYDNQWNL